MSRTIRDGCSQVLWLISAALLLGAGSFLGAAALRPRGWATLLMGAGLLGLAQVVLLAELLSLIDALGRVGWSVGHALFALATATAWLARGRFLPARPAVSVEVIRHHPMVATAVAAATAAALFQLVLGLTTAPSNWDSMTYHLSRAAYWLQEGSIARFDGGSIRQLSSAPNAEIAVAWTMAMRGTDGWVSAVQWLALLGSAGALWIIVRDLGFSAAAAAFAAAVWVLLPGPLVQATTTQNDLITSSLLLATIAFGLRALRHRRGSDVMMAAIAFGLAIGTKGTMLFALPSLALILAAALWQWRPPLRTVAALSGSAAIAAVTLGGFGYINNLYATGSPVGGLPALAEPEFPPLPNGVRVAWSFVDSPGVSMPWADRLFGQTLGRRDDEFTPEWFDFTLDTSTGEDTVAAGLVGLLVLIPLALWATAGRQRTPLLRALGAGGLLYVVLFGVLHTATPYNGRVLMPAVVFAAPLLALAAQRPWSRVLVLALAVTSALPILLTNTGKPVLVDLGTPNVWQMSHQQQMTISRPDTLPVVSELDRRFGPGTRLGFLGGEDSWDYPLFGPSLERTVVRVDPADVPREPPEATCAWLRAFAQRANLDALVFADAPREVAAPPEALGAAELSPGNFIVDTERLRDCDRASQRAK